MKRPVGISLRVCIGLFSLWWGGMSSSPALGVDGTGLQTSIAVDTLGTFGSEGLNGATNRIDLREAEFMFYAPIDHYFDGMLGIAAHYEQGALFAEAHGAYIETTKLIPRSRLKFGQYFLGFGKLNRVHRHDWPFVTTPHVIQTFFDREGLIDTGIEYGFLFPTPFFLDLTFGVTNGWNFGHAHTEGTKPHVPTHYGRLATYVPLPGEGGLEAGLNYVGRTASSGTRSSFVGLDLVAKWRGVKHVDWLFQSEVWYRDIAAPGKGANQTLGLYFYPQRYLGRQLYLGVRLDYDTVLTATDAFGADLSNYYVALEPTLTWQPSEFSRLRLAYAYRGQNEGGVFTSNDQVVMLQATFIIGAHPAHEF